MKQQAEIGVFGGSGFYSFLSQVETVAVNTPFGDPSDEFAIGTLAGLRVAFLPRHGRGHTIPPHSINYRANLWAMKELGITRVIAPCAVGSLRADLTPRDFVVPDDYINFTSGRPQTFHDGPKVVHVHNGAHRYCPDLRQRAVAALTANGCSAHDGGVTAVVNGPRFSTPAESRMFRQLGADLINMTQYPEAYLARELGLCYVTIAIITDWDCGVEGVHHAPMQEMLANFGANNDALKRVVVSMIENLDAAQPTCTCRNVPAESAMN